MGTNRSNNMNIEEIEQDILGVHPEDTERLIPPYDRNDDEQRKFDKAHRALRRSIQLKMRLFSMINAFYLGKILNDCEDLANRSKYRKGLSKHYLAIADYTFDLFEQYPEQILATKTLDVQQIRKLKRPNILQLREKLFEFFVGTQILVGEDCYQQM